MARLETDPVKLAAEQIAAAEYAKVASAQKKRAEADDHARTVAEAVATADAPVKTAGLSVDALHKAIRAAEAELTLLRSQHTTLLREVERREKVYADACRLWESTLNLRKLQTKQAGMDPDEIGFEAMGIGPKPTIDHAAANALHALAYKIAAVENDVALYRRRVGELMNADTLAAFTAGGA